MFETGDLNWSSPDEDSNRVDNNKADWVEPFLGPDDVFRSFKKNVILVSVNYFFDFPVPFYTAFTTAVLL